MIPTDPNQLPDDVDALKAIIAAAHAQKALADQERRALEAMIVAHRAEITVHQAEIEAHEAEIAAMRAAKTADAEKIARLESIVVMLKRAQFGRSEKLWIDPLDAEQMAFVFDELQTGLGETRAERDKRAGTAASRPPRPRKGFAPHLERIEQIIEPEVPADCVGLQAVRIGEDVSERLDVTPATFRAIVSELFIMLDRDLPRLSGKAKLAEIIRYTLSRRTAFERFLADGRIEIDSNIVERAIRPQTITRKNALFVGSDGGGRTWATIATLLTTAKMNSVDPNAWLTQTLERIASGWPNSQIADLMPWNFSQ